MARPLLGTAIRTANPRTGTFRCAVVLLTCPDTSRGTTIQICNDRSAWDQPDSFCPITKCNSTLRKNLGPPLDSQAAITGALAGLVKQNLDVPGERLAKATRCSPQCHTGGTVGRLARGHSDRDLGSRPRGLRARPAAQPLSAVASLSNRACRPAAPADICLQCARSAI